MHSRSSPLDFGIETRFGGRDTLVARLDSRRTDDGFFLLFADALHFLLDGLVIGTVGSVVVDQSF